MKKKSMLLIAVTISSIFFYIQLDNIAQAQQKGELEEILTLLNKKASTIQTYDSDYSISRIIHDGIIKTDVRCLYKKGVGLKVTLATPKEDGGVEVGVMIARDDKIINYSPLRKTMARVNLKKLGTMFGGGKAFLFDPRENFVLTKPWTYGDLRDFKPVSWKIDKIEGKNFYLFDLKLKKLPPAPPGITPVSPVVKVWLDADNGLLSKIRMYQNDSIVYKFDVKNIKINIDIPSESFNFVPPPGTATFDDTESTWERLNQREKEGPR